MRVEDDLPAAPVVPLPATRAERAGALRERVQSLKLPAHQVPDRTRFSRLPWILCFILSGVSLWMGSQLYLPDGARSSDAAGSQGKTTDQQEGRAGAAAETASTTEVANHVGGNSDQPTSAAPGADQKVVLESKGYIIAAHQILVSPKVSGVVTRLPIEEGSRVKKGDILAELEDVDYKTDYERYVGERESAHQRLLELERGNRPEEIAQARAQLQEAEAQFVQAEADWKRMQALRERNVATPADYDSSQSRYYQLQRQVDRLRFAYSLMELGPRKEKIDAARADYQTAVANVDKAKWKLDNTKIRAPISGTILKKNAEEGNLVNAIAFSGSVSLCEMADLSDLEVDLTVQERDISRVFKGQKCRVRAEAYPERIYQGVVSRLMPIADRAKGAISVRVKLTVPRAEEGVYLKPEMGAIVTFYGGAEKASAKVSAKS